MRYSKLEIKGDFDEETMMKLLKLMNLLREEKMAKIVSIHFE